MVSGSRWRRSNVRVAIPNSSDPRLEASALDVVVFDVLPHPLVWIELRGIAGKEEQLQPTLEGGDVVLDDLGFMEGNVVENKEDRPGSIVHELLQELHEHGAVATSEEHVELERTAGETAEIMLTDVRSPVTSTTGVCPTGAQVVPA